MNPPVRTICNGVVQNSVSRIGEDGGFVAWTEWLETDGPVSWTRDPRAAFLFFGDAKNTGYERAQMFADALNAMLGVTTHHACTRSKVRPPQEPPMPARDRVVDRRTRAAAEDWHARAVNCGVQ